MGFEFQNVEQICNKYSHNSRAKELDTKFDRAYKTVSEV